jgi:hypothetical protein
MMRARSLRWDRRDWLEFGGALGEVHEFDD